MSQSPADRGQLHASGREDTGHRMTACMRRQSPSEDGLRGLLKVFLIRIIVQVPSVIIRIEKAAALSCGHLVDALLCPHLRDAVSELWLDVNIPVRCIRLRCVVDPALRDGVSLPDIDVLVVHVGVIEGDQLADPEPGQAEELSQEPPAIHLHGIQHGLQFVRLHKFRLQLHFPSVVREIFQLVRERCGADQVLTISPADAGLQILYPGIRACLSLFCHEEPAHHVGSGQPVNDGVCSDRTHAGLAFVFIPQGGRVLDGGLLVFCVPVYKLLQSDCLRSSRLLELLLDLRLQDRRGLTLVLCSVLCQRAGYVLFYSAYRVDVPLDKAHFSISLLCPHKKHLLKW